MYRVSAARWRTLTATSTRSAHANCRLRGAHFRGYPDCLSLRPGVTAARRALDEVVGVHIPGAQFSVTPAAMWSTRSALPPGSRGVDLPGMAGQNRSGQPGVER